MTTDQLEADLGRVLGEAADRVEPAATCSQA